MTYSLKAARIASAQQCVELRAFAALHPIYGGKFGNLLLELARLSKGDGPIWIAPDAFAARLGVSRATFYRIASAAADAGLISALARSRVGTRVRVNWLHLGPVFAAALRVADAVRMKTGRYMARVKVGSAKLRAMVAGGFGSSHGEAVIIQEQRSGEKKAPVVPSSASLSVDEYLRRCSERARFAVKGGV